MSTQGASILPSFYGEKGQDGTLIERSPGAPATGPSQGLLRPTDQLNRRFTSRSATAPYSDNGPVQSKIRPASLHEGHGGRLRKWSMHMHPSGGAAQPGSPRYRTYNNAIGGASPRSRGHGVATMSSDSSSESDGETRRRHRQRRKEKRARLEELEQQQPLRLPWTQWMASETKNHFVAGEPWSRIGMSGGS